MFGYSAMHLFHPGREFFETERAVVVLIHHGEEGLRIGDPPALGAGRWDAARAGHGAIGGLRAGGLRTAMRPLPSCPRHRRRARLQRLFELVKSELLVPVLVGLLEPGFQRLRGAGRDFVGRDGPVVILVQPVEKRVGIAPLRLFRLSSPDTRR